LILGGTLVDFEPLPRWAAVAERLMRAAHVRVGCEAPALEKFLPTMLDAVRGEAVRQLELQGIGTPWEERLRRGLASFALELPPNLPDELARLISEELAPTARIDAGVLPTLAALKEARLHLGLISNTPWDTPGHYLEGLLRSEGLLEYLPVRLFSGDVGVRKPSARIFALALEAYGVAPENAVFVGDDLHSDIRGALNAGWHALWRRPRTMEDPVPPGCKPISAIADIPGLLLS